LTARTIAETLRATGELIDTHTAVGYAVARQSAASSSPMVTLATAHPAKFPDAVEKASGIRPGLPPRLAHLMAAPERFTVLPNDVGRVRDFILSQQQA
jgi:threonine synthase